MGRLDNAAYMDDVRACASLGIDWSCLADRRVLITGATGMIGAFLVDVLMERNRAQGLNCSVMALGRSRDKASSRLPYEGEKNYAFYERDISIPGLDFDVVPDIAIHLASATHPRAYASDPIGTIASNVNGAQNLLSLVSRNDQGTFVLASSVEIYGENRGDVRLFDESYCGYIDCNTMRAGYPESKRLCEALCQAYAVQSGVDVRIPRLPRTYGPTVLPTDSKALSQFIARGVAGEDIVLKSEGTQEYSYLYVSDTVSGILNVLASGEPGRAYNLADEASNISLRELAASIASVAGSKIVFELPDALESAGYSKATKAMMDGAALNELGWKPRYSIDEGVRRTVKILRTIG